MKTASAKRLSRASRLKSEACAVYFAYRDPRTPWYAKAFAAVVVAYALSPIDLIPDFIPILGWLDDLILVPCGVALALRMIPKDVMHTARSRASECTTPGRRTSMLAAFVILVAWAALAAIGIAIGVRVVGAS